jgi:hypothetical protein
VSSSIEASQMGKMTAEDTTLIVFGRQIAYHC